ncbi:PREDICTED: F-box protein At3g28330-like [Camelina sativa]|uniref:F-box protein At3g28330-like n=1 Tax=Camelina sativa TaxID=90675 RepID=A0ABM0SKT8_CAMSA|nr:PREDICTED: F-box protein At3g28330-like [Camelina sativa]XP_010412626.1 PREDICTED: F-box protein At3g28330-like [Camelina sativa]
MCRVLPEPDDEVVAHYGCETWGLQRSLGSYITSFLNHRFNTQYPIITLVEAYTHVGLILITSGVKHTYYVANPISRQCVKIPHPPPTPTRGLFFTSGLVTQIENDVFLGYKVVLMDTSNVYVLSLLIYSSETGLWSFKTLQSSLPLSSLNGFNPISLNGSLHWIGSNSDYGEVLESHDFYATGKESDRCQATPFPDVGTKTKLRRVCTTSQGFIMYMNLVSQDKDDGHVKHKLRVWRLNSREWLLVSEISPACCETGFDYIPLTINPFDANTMYMMCKMHQCLASTNFHEDKFGRHNSLECCNDYQTLSFAGDCNLMEGLYHSYFCMFVLPRWLHKIPSSPS